MRRQLVAFAFYAPLSVLAQPVEDPNSACTAVAVSGGNPATFLARQGSVEDSATGLQWTASDNDATISATEAKSWCEGKGSGWRLPTRSELQTLFNASPSAKVPCGFSECSVPAAFDLTSSLYWTSHRIANSGDLAAAARVCYVSLSYGTSSSQVESGGLEDIRALCVRGIFKPPLPRGSILVTVDPPSADIFVDDVHVGHGSQRVRHLNPGVNYRLEARLDGRHIAATTISVRSGEVKRVQLGTATDRN